MKRAGVSSSSPRKFRKECNVGEDQDEDRKPSNSKQVLRGSGWLEEDGFIVVTDKKKDNQAKRKKSTVKAWIRDSTKQKRGTTPNPYDKTKPQSKEVTPSAKKEVDKTARAEGSETENSMQGPKNVRGRGTGSNTTQLKPRKEAEPKRRTKVSTEVAATNKKQSEGKTIKDKGDETTKQNNPGEKRAKRVQTSKGKVSTDETAKGEEGKEKAEHERGMKSTPVTDPFSTNARRRERSVENEASKKKKPKTVLEKGDSEKQTEDDKERAGDKTKEGNKTNKEKNKMKEQQKTEGKIEEILSRPKGKWPEKKDWEDLGRIPSKELRIYFLMSVVPQDFTKEQKRWVGEVLKYAPSAVLTEYIGDTNKFIKLCKEVKAKGPGAHDAEPNTMVPGDLTMAIKRSKLEKAEGETGRQELKRALKILNRTAFQEHEEELGKHLEGESYEKLRELVFTAGEYARYAKGHGIGLKKKLPEIITLSAQDGNTKLDIRRYRPTQAKKMDRAKIEAMKSKNEQIKTLRHYWWQYLTKTYPEDRQVVFDHVTSLSIKRQLDLVFIPGTLIEEVIRLIKLKEGNEWPSSQQGGSIEGKERERKSDESKTEEIEQEEEDETESAQGEEITWSSTNKNQVPEVISEMNSRVLNREGNEGKVRDINGKEDTSNLFGTFTTRTNKVKIYTQRIKVEMNEGETVDIAIEVMQKYNRNVSMICNQKKHYYVQIPYFPSDQIDLPDIVGYGPSFPQDWDEAQKYIQKAHILPPSGDNKRTLLFEFKVITSMDPWEWRQLYPRAPDHDARRSHTAYLRREGLNVAMLERKDFDWVIAVAFTNGNAADDVNLARGELATRVLIEQNVRIKQQEMKIVWVKMAVPAHIKEYHGPRPFHVLWVNAKMADEVADCLLKLRPDPNHRSSFIVTNGWKVHDFRLTYNTNQHEFVSPWREQTMYMQNKRSISIYGVPPGVDLAVYRPQKAGGEQNTLTVAQLLLEDREIYDVAGRKMGSPFRSITKTGQPGKWQLNGLAEDEYRMTEWAKKDGRYDLLEWFGEEAMKHTVINSSTRGRVMKNDQIMVVQQQGEQQGNLSNMDEFLNLREEMERLRGLIVEVRPKEIGRNYETPTTKQKKQDLNMELIERIRENANKQAPGIAKELIKAIEEAVGGFLDEQQCGSDKNQLELQHESDKEQEQDESVEGKEMELDSDIASKSSESKMEIESEDYYEKVGTHEENMEHSNTLSEPEESDFTEEDTNDSEEEHLDANEEEETKIRIMRPNTNLLAQTRHDGTKNWQYNANHYRLAQMTRTYVNSQEEQCAECDEAVEYPILYYCGGCNRTYHQKCLKKPMEEMLVYGDNDMGEVNFLCHKCVDEIQEAFEESSSRAEKYAEKYTIRKREDEWNKDDDQSVISLTESIKNCGRVTSKHRIAHPGLALAEYLKIDMKAMETAENNKEFHEQYLPKLSEYMEKHYPDAAIGVTDRLARSTPWPTVWDILSQPKRFTDMVKKGELGTIRTEWETDQKGGRNKSNDSGGDSSDDENENMDDRTREEESNQDSEGEKLEEDETSKRSDEEDGSDGTKQSTSRKTYHHRGMLDDSDITYEDNTEALQAEKNEYNRSIGRPPSPIKAFFDRGDGMTTPIDLTGSDRKKAIKKVNEAILSQDSLTPHKPKTLSKEYESDESEDSETSSGEEELGLSSRKGIEEMCNPEITASARKHAEEVKRRREEYNNRPTSSESSESESEVEATDKPKLTPRQRLDLLRKKSKENETQPEQQEGSPRPSLSAMKPKMASKTILKVKTEKQEHKAGKKSPGRTPRQQIERHRTHNTQKQDRAAKTSTEEEKVQAKKKEQKTKTKERLQVGPRINLRSKSKPTRVQPTRNTSKK